MFGKDHQDRLISVVRQAARDHILPRFRNLAESDISTKSGPADLVTLADTEAEAAITTAVRQFWPEVEVLGEEAVAANPDLRSRMGTAEWAVVIDPVDGTWNFAKGLALFGIILAVLHRGLPVFSVLYDPILDDWIEASTDRPSRMVWPDGHRDLATSSQTDLRRMNGYVGLGLYPRAIRAEIVPHFPEFGRVSSLRCACHEYRMVAQGHADFCLSGPVPHPWDHAAGVLAVRQAGGVARFLDGEAYHADRARGVVLAASSEGTWAAVAQKFGFLAGS